MAIAYWCVLIAIFLPLLFTGIAKASDGGRGFDNHQPRVFQARLEGYRARAHWAHQNMLEAFPPFAAAVLVAEQLGAAQGRIDVLAVCYIVLRGIYGGCYIANLSTARSIVWALALACVVGLFAVAAVAPG